jgi:CO/xanthine dehydrogenase FAD-binding subunit
MLNLRVARPDAVIDLNRISALSYITETDEGLEVGALTRYRDVERSDIALRICPLLRETIGHIAHRVIRNRGTIGGSLANAHPAAELPAALLALNGAVKVAGPSGERRIAADDLFISPFTTSLLPSELITAVVFPRLSPATGYAFREFSRRHGDFALAAVAAVVANDNARLVVAGISGRPILVKTDNPAAVAEVADVDDSDETDGEYRRGLVRSLAGEAIVLARRRAEARS